MWLFLVSLAAKAGSEDFRSPNFGIPPLVPERAQEGE